MFKRIVILTLMFFCLSLFANSNTMLSTIPHSEAISHTTSSDCEHLSSSTRHHNNSENDCANCPPHQFHCCHINLAFNSPEKDLQLQAPVVNIFFVTNDLPKASPDLEAPLQPPKKV